MNRKQCKEALDVYKKFLVRMDRVSEFLKVAENVGIDKGDIPDLTKAPSSLLDALEQHYNHLEGKKSSTSSSNSTNQKNVKSGVTALSSTSSAFGNAVANAKFDNITNGIDESLKLQILAEEEAAMNQFKSKVSSPSTVNNPFLSNSSSSSATASSQSTPQVDLFATEPSHIQVKASDDLLQLSNPFADAFAAPQQNAPNAFVPQQHQNAWIPNGNGFGVQPVMNNSVISNGAFVSETNFASVFGNPDTQVSSTFDALGGVLQPMNTIGQPAGNIVTSNGSNGASNNNHQNGNGLLTGDLESSLASLAENLTINDRKQALKGVQQWNSPKHSSKPSWTPQPMSATTGANYKPMNQSMANAPFAAPMAAQPSFPQMQPVVGIRPMTSTHAILTPLAPMAAMPPTPNQMGQQSQLMFH